jgi:hypothetical protein
VPFILNANAQVMCSHGGTFQFVPATAPTVMANNTPVLLDTTQFLTVPAGAGAPVPATVVFPRQTTIQGA